MKTFLRADFDFSENEIKRCKGYVICEDVQIKNNGNYTFKVHSVVVQKYIGSRPDFEKVEKLAIQKCRLFNDVIDVGSLSDYHD